MKRNPKGQYTRDLVLYKGFIIACSIGAVIVISFIGVQRVYSKLIDTFSIVVEVKNTYAEEKEPTLMEKIEIHADEYNVSAYQMKRTIECESNFRNIQSLIVKDGIREKSYGIAQINLPAHPNVTIKQALDVDFSIEWMAKHFHSVTWYGYNRKTDKCN